VSEWEGPALEWKQFPKERWAGGLVPPRATARYVRGGLLYTLEIRVRDGEPELESLRIDAPEGGAIPRVPGLPLKELLTRALNALRWSPPEPAGKGVRLHPEPIDGPARRDMTRGFLAQVAQVWKDARAEGVGGTKAVKDSFGVSYRTAARWVAAARESKLIPKESKR